MKQTAALEALRNWGERIDALNLRERALVFAGVLGVLLLLAINYVFPPLQAEQKRLDVDLKTKRDQTRLLYAQMEGAAHATQRNADADNRAHITELKAKLRSIEGDSAPGAQQLISPREMVRLVRDLLARNQALALVRLENLPATALADPAAAPNIPAAAVPAAGQIYRHGLRIQVRGRYRDIARYVQAIEALPWRVFWGEVSLETKTYPMSELTLVLYTLSPNPEWIGT